MRPLRQQALLIPHWPLELMPASGSVTNPASSVHSLGAQYTLDACMATMENYTICIPPVIPTRHQQAGTAWSGKHAFGEMARQRCLANNASDAPPQARLEYLERLHALCKRSLSVRGDVAQAERCSIQQLAHVGVNVEAILKCSRNPSLLLKQETEIPMPGWGSLALRIDGWIYGGVLELDLVVEAICSVLHLDRELGPAACEELWNW